MSEPKNSMNLAGVTVLSDTDSVEIARLWVTNRGPSTVFINAGPLADPVMFGMLLADTAHHGAKAYAQQYGISEEEALSRIWQGLDLERNDPSGSMEHANPFGRTN
jgi:hypothetical protein